MQLLGELIPNSVYNKFTQASFLSLSILAITTAEGQLQVSFAYSNFTINGIDNNCILVIVSFSKHNLCDTDTYYTSLLVNIQDSIYTYLILVRGQERIKYCMNATHIIVNGSQNLFYVSNNTTESNAAKDTCYKPLCKYASQFWFSM